MQTADCRLADYISCYLYEYILYIPPIPIPIYLYEALVWLTEVLVWLTQARVCKSAVCICRTPHTGCYENEDLRPKAHLHDIHFGYGTPKFWHAGQ